MDQNINSSRAQEVSKRGVTPQRWIVELSSHEIGLRPHNHLFFTNLNEITEDGNIFNIVCQICFKQYDVQVNSLGFCNGLSHHLHTEFKEDSVSAMCCQCNSTIIATMSQSTIPQSLLHRIRMGRKPKSTSPTVPLFYDTIDLLVKILRDAVNPEPRSINVESNAFRNKIGFDEPM